jgi:hypothetical protein
MSSIEKKRTRIAVAVTTLLVAATCLSSLSFSARAETPAPTVETEPIVDSSNLQVAAISGAFAAYGWLAAKSYDLGREIGKSMAGASRPSEQRALADDRLEYLLD